MREREILKSLWKPQLYAGIELIPFIFIVFFTGEVMMNANTIWLRVFGGVVGFAMWYAMRQVNKKEPYQFSIIIRYISFQKLYLNVAKCPSRPYRIHNKDV